MSAKGHLTGLPSVNEALLGKGNGEAASIISEIPDMPTKLSAKEKKIWEHVTLALLEYGLIHRTDGLTISIICRTYIDWVDATNELDDVKKNNNGSYIMESANGYRSPHPLYYVARDHKKSLLEWLPEAALTIPSFHKIKGNQVDTPQGDLFDDPVEAHRGRKAAINLRQVNPNGNAN